MNEWQTVPLDGTYVLTAAGTGRYEWTDGDTTVTLSLACETLEGGDAFPPRIAARTPDGAGHYFEIDWINQYGSTTWTREEEILTDGSASCSQSKIVAMPAGCCCPGCCRLVAPFLPGGAVSGDPKSAGITVTISGFTHTYLGSPPISGDGEWHLEPTDSGYFLNTSIGAVNYGFGLYLYCNDDSPPTFAAEVNDTAHATAISTLWTWTDGGWEVANEVYSAASISVGQTSSQPMPANCCCPDCCCRLTPFLDGPGEHSCVAGNPDRAEFAIAIVNTSLGDNSIAGGYTVAAHFSGGEFESYSVLITLGEGSLRVSLFVNCSPDFDFKPQISAMLLDSDGELLDSVFWTWEDAGGWDRLGVGDFAGIASVIQTHAEPIPRDCCDNPGIPLTCGCGSFKAPNGWYVIPNSCKLDYMSGDGSTATAGCDGCPVIILRPVTVESDRVIYHATEPPLSTCGFSTGGCGIDIGGVHGILVRCGDGVIEYSTTTVGLTDFPNQTTGCNVSWPTITYDSTAFGHAAGYLSAAPCSFVEALWADGASRHGCVAGGCVGDVYYEHDVPPGVTVRDYYAVLYSDSVTYVPF